MRQLVFRSADIYCQIVNNLYLRNVVILYQNGKKGKGLAPGETERDCVCERRRVAENEVGVHSKNGRWKKD